MIIGIRKTMGDQVVRDVGYIARYQDQHPESEKYTVLNSITVRTSNFRGGEALHSGKDR